MWSVNSYRWKLECAAIFSSAIKLPLSLKVLKQMINYSKVQQRRAYAAAAAAAKSLQSCPTLCDPTEGSPPGSAITGILQARTLEWVAISFSNAWKWKVKVKSLSRVWLFPTPWAAGLGFSRQEYWNGLPLPFP